MRIACKVIICFSLIWGGFVKASPNLFRLSNGHSVFVNLSKKTNTPVSNSIILVSNAKELKSAFSAAKPGDTIVMKDGIWHDVIIDFNATANSKASITLRAQTSGNVILNGNSMLTFSKPYLIVEGLFFKDGALNKQNAVISFDSDNCRVSNTAILNYNPTDFLKNYYWIYFNGSHNRLDHCFFKGKSNMNPVLQNAEENARYNKVDRCYIKDIPYVPNANGREIFRIFGYGHADQPGNDGAYFTIEYNLFDHAHGEGTEIVSLKSNYDTVRFNTVVSSRGGLVGRRGKFNTFEGNIVLGQGQEGSTGIRVAGSNHRVINNYIADVAEDGLRLITGEYYEKSLTTNFAPKKKDLPKYLQVQNGYFAHNTIVNCGGYGIDIGYSYKAQWPGLQMVLLPENNRLVDNIVYNCRKNVINITVPDKNPPLDFFNFKSNYFEGNIVFGRSALNRYLPTEIKTIDPLLKLNKDGLYHLQPNSPVYDKGARTEANQGNGDKPQEKNDVPDATMSILHPLNAYEVGPDWIIKRTKSGEKI